MARKPTVDVAAWPALTLEGNLLAPAIIAAVERRDASQQDEADYDVRKGLTLRDEISTAFRVAQAHYDSFARLHAPSAVATVRYVRDLLREAFGFADLADATAPLALSAGTGRVPIVVVPSGDALDRRSAALSAERSRSAVLALQDALNGNDACLWGLATNGNEIRLMRDNASLTRPAYIEADLARIFEAEDMASFAVLWLLIHRSRFGEAGRPATDCALERWRDEGSRAGEAARDRLAAQVEQALRDLGSGFLEADPALRRRLLAGEINLTAWFNELLRLVYRLIFLMVAEDRDLLHAPGADAAARRLYAEGFGLAMLRTHAVRRGAWDRHHDRYEGMKIVFRALSRGEPRLGLPALGGLFAPGQLVTLDAASLSNRAFLSALYRLGWLSDRGAVVPVNWQAMETEELGSVYESLLELQPQLADDGRVLRFASDAAETRGNQRKSTGSYYTPDSLVQALLDTALDPVLDRAESGANDPAESLLSLSVIDPACGSGHFLLAAARRIATRVARHRTQGTPSTADFRHALRDVARRCLYGVDRNPMAVELAKVALWIETVDPGLPLGFFDAQIRCGDSLLGVFDLAVLGKGIPDGAFKALTDDDKETTKHYSKRNANERDGQGSFEFIRGGGSLPESRPLTDFDSELRALPETTLDEIDTKARRFQALRAGDSWSRWHTACDLYVAAFLAPKSGGVPENRNTVTIPTTAHVWGALAGRTLYGPLIAHADDLVNAGRAFHWPLEFPDVMAKGGFDVVIGNPPWERVEVQEQELFASSHPEIVNAQNATKRKRMIEALADTDQRAFNMWRSALRMAATGVAFFKESGRFPFGSAGKVNTYAVFADLFRQLVSPTGRAGAILPNGLVAGFTYREFLRHLLDTKTLVSFYGFENEDKLFRSVHNETKFGLLTVTGDQQPIERPWFTAHLRQPSQISDADRRYALTIEAIRAINPNTLNLPAFRWARDAEVAAAIHQAGSVLVRKADDDREENPWRVRFLSMFNMATDSSLFLDNRDIGPSIVERRRALAVLRDGRKVYPLYEGKMFWHFDHRYGTYDGQTEKQANKGVLPRVSEICHADPLYSIEPRYWVEASIVHEALKDDAAATWFFSWRDVGPSERTLIGTIVPLAALGHASPIAISSLSVKQQMVLFTVLSSLVVDYAARQKSTRMTFFVVEQLPLISPELALLGVNWLGETLEEWICDRAIELFYTNVELSGLALDLGRNHPPFKWNPERRSLLQAEIDAAVLHLYGLDRSKAEWLIDSFTVLRKYEEREVGEFRTKRLVLEIYDQMAEAMQREQQYLTKLNPPPADRTLYHVVELKM